LRHQIRNTHRHWLLFRLVNDSVTA